eukprot:674126-Ditylum_brightwellii.AAC.1
MGMRHGSHSLNGVLHYINNFLACHQELGNIPNEGWSENHVLNGSKNESLDDTVLAHRKHEHKLDKKHIEKRKFKNTVQRMIDNKEITFDWDNDERSSCPMKKARRTKN